MKSLTKNLSITAILAVGIGVAYLSYVSPAATLEKIKNAARENDKDRLRDLIDFDSVKAGLKEDIKALMVASSSQELKANPFAAPGMALAGMMVDPLVEAIVTPTGLTNLIEKASSDPLKNETGSKASENSPKAVDARDDVRIDQGYDDFSRYRVRIGHSGDKPGQFLTVTLKREGLFSWRMTRISLPSDRLDVMAKNQVGPGPQRRAKEMAIDSSDLQAVEGRQNVIALTAVLRNMAQFPQEFPALELTLKSDRDEALARRVFLPADYLPTLSEEQRSRGIEPSGKVAIRMLFETRGIHATDYHMYLHYPTEDPAPAARQVNAESIVALPTPRP
jgi:hypothetical protein